MAFHSIWRRAALACALIALAGGAAAEDAKGGPDEAKARAKTPLEAMLDQAISLPSLSPSGRYLAYDRTEGDVDQLVMLDLDTQDSKVLFRTKPATKDQAAKELRQEIADIGWKSDDRLLLSLAVPIGGYARDILGPEPVVTFITDRAGGHAVMLKAQTAVVDYLYSDPDHMLVEMYDNNDVLCVFKVGITVGSFVMIERGPPRVVDYTANSKGEIVMRTVRGEGLFSGSYAILEGRAPGSQEWTRMFEVHPKSQNIFSDKIFVAATDDPGVFLVQAAQDTGKGDTRAIRLFDAVNARLGDVVYANDAHDVEDAVLDPATHAVLAGCYHADVYICEYKDKTFQAQRDAMVKHFEGLENVAVVSQARNGSRWIVRTDGPNDPGTFYIYQPKSDVIAPLGRVAPDVDPASLGETRRFDFKTRDGQALSGYLTLPKGAGPAPLVVLPHGGPEARDDTDFDLWVHYLASRGYAVLQANFRGSGGFGRTFAAAGYGQWGARMSDDLDDAVSAALATGKLDPKRVCIVGASYGGYAALYAAGVHPDLYRCAVSIDGLSDLTTDMAWEKRHNGADSDAYHYWLKSEGDPAKDADRLTAKSPVNMVRSWSVPLLLIHGDADEIVDVTQSREMRDALTRAHKDVRYDEVKNMGHGPQSHKEWVRVLTEIGDFVDQHIGPAPAP